MTFSLLKFASANSFFLVGKDYFTIGRYQEAVAVLKEAVTRKQDFAEAHYQLGLAYHGLGDKASAMNEWRILKNLNQKMADELYSIYFIAAEHESLIIKEKEKTEPDEPKSQNNKTQEEIFRKPSMFENPTVRRMVRSKTAWIISGVVILIIWGAITDNNKTRSPSTKGSGYSQPTSTGNSYGTGQYRCSSYHIEKAKALEPDATIKVQLDLEETELNKLSGELKSLQATIKNTTVNEYSQESINHYNRLVNSYNKQIKSLKSRATDFDNKSKIFNGRIDAYNNYLDNNCTKAR